MNKILKLNQQILCLAILALLTSHVFAESLVQFESNLINQYDKVSLTDSYESEGINQEVSLKISNFIQSHPQSFAYNFKKLVSKSMVSIRYSPDQKLKFYTFDISAGGTMREFESYVQFKYKGNVITQALADSGFIKSIQQTELNKVPTYFISRTYIGSSCVGAYDIQAAQIQNAKYKAVKVFKTKTKALDHIDVSYDCHYYPKNIQPYNMNRHYIRVSKNLGNIDILVIKPSGELTPNYLRYQKTKSNYQYMGTVK
ncbi:hypothetical protein [Acinetobacter bouvetii]|uniref:Uncharacterized protein n=1 Tax=Acinetobacter bouvetii TaxID=202951 RepID=A0A811GDW8_9GAMM|nr:hypothetical protein [Acinetobacter bouvetii]CAB1221220.1 hypothetical protein SFB21_2717 [Acinetobacter bouvetii]